jgi:DNA replication ATP-dependent helicase Dna2
MLYNLLASERYGVDVSSGLLYYTQSEEVVQVPIGQNELRGLMIARNEMAGYITRRYDKQHRKTGDVASSDSTTLSSRPFLPPTIDDERACKRCYSLDTCMLYRRVRILFRDLHLRESD